MTETDRLRLVPLVRVHAEALARGPAALAALLGIAVPMGWPKFPEAFFRHDGSPRPPDTPPAWPGYLFVSPAIGALVGNGGFTGPPDAAGVVEIGYEIAPAYRGRGLATEAVREMLAVAFADGAVRAVRAHTLAETTASGRVLEKAGMRFVTEVDGDEGGAVWRWELHRDETLRESAPTS